MTISFPQSSSTCSSIKQWEVAGASLVTALTNYANSCLSLSTNYEPNDAHARDLAFQISSALETHSNIALQLRQSGASLSRVRNRVATSLHRVPEDVLAQIFTNVIFGLQNNERQPNKKLNDPSVEASLLQVYRRRYNLLGVCSIWRTIISTRANFWSTMLVPNAGISHEILEPYLQKIGENILRPVVTTRERISEHVITALSRRIPQIRSLIIQSPNNLVFSQIIGIFLRKDVPHSLVELSLRRTSGSHEESKQILSSNAHGGFIASSTLMESLSVLRISCIYLQWDPALARNLVELQIHDLDFATEAHMIVHLKYISSAPRLRNLKIFSFDTSTFSSGSAIQPHTISFPNLQSLTIGDCYEDCLKLLFTSIAPGSHCLILRITNTSYYPRFYDGEIHTCIAAYKSLLETLKLAPVDSLLLDGDSENPFAATTPLRSLLACTPGLKTLKLAWWTTIEQLQHILLPPSDTEGNSDEPELPRLRELHLISIDTCDEEGLKVFVDSHQIQRLVLGARKYSTASRTPGELNVSRSLSIETADWLRSRVPEFYSVDPEYYPPDFNFSGWELGPW